MKNNFNPSINIVSVGCKLNQYETEKMYSQFLKKGFAPVSKNADLCIVNTCTVTRKADRKSRNLIRRVQKNNPKAKIVVTGCYATTNPSDIAALNRIDLIVDNQKKNKIDSYIIERFFPEQKTTTLEKTQDFSSRTRPFLKIQDGCSHRCSYCKIWIARGRPVGVNPKEILFEIDKLVQKGIKEIVFTGVNILDYQYANLDFVDLMKLILSQNYPVRYRLSSLFPSQISDKLLPILLHESICNHFHFSLQSGSQSILRKMNRFYDLNHVLSMINLIKKERPYSGIGADIITGFPQETDKLFEETKNFLEEAQIPFLHIFRYSERQGTQSAKMSDDVPPDKKNQRSKILEALKIQVQTSFFNSLVGQELNVLIQSPYKGIANNYVEVHFQNNMAKFKNTIVKSKIISVENLKVFGSPCRVVEYD